jgi:hypothetical protein
MVLIANKKENPRIEDLNRFMAKLSSEVFDQPTTLTLMTHYDGLD